MLSLRALLRRIARLFSSRPEIRISTHVLCTKCQRSIPFDAIICPYCKVTLMTPAPMKAIPLTFTPRFWREAQTKRPILTYLENVHPVKEGTNTARHRRMHLTSSLTPKSAK